MADRRIEPGPGQESVWDYPRPPRVEPSRRRVRVEFDGVTVADSTRALRVLETSQPPAYYVPPEDVRMDLLVPSGGRRTLCEWKGMASYLDVRTGGRVGRRAAWTYPDPLPGFAGLTGLISFYPARVDGCFLDDERVSAQPGDYYGGWVTADIVGPFKGGPGTEGW
jgi:uncharacterized protein (DUF427 family)